MMRKPLCLVLLLTVAAVGLAQAQDKPTGPKLYRWVDKQGKVHYDDALPPEAVDQARREFSAKTGTATGSIDRALTDEERAQLAADAQAAALAQANAGELKRQEDIMMASYQSENDLRRAYGERISLLKLTLESTEVSIRSLGDNLASMLSQASDVELDNRKVMPERQAAIQALHVERVKQQLMQQARRADLAALNTEFARMLARYRELRSSAAPAAAPATPVAGG